MAHHPLAPVGDLQQCVQVDPGFDAHSVQQVDQVFRGQVARGARRVGAAPQPAHRAVEAGDPHLQPGQHVGQRRGLGVVQVQPDALGVVEGHHLFQQPLDLDRGAHADGVAQHDVIGAIGDQLARDLRHLFRWHLALEGAAADHADRRDDPHPFLLDGRNQLGEHFQALGNGPVDVGLVVAFRGGHEYAHLLQSGFGRALQSPHVGHQRRGVRAVHLREHPADFLAVGQCRNPLGMHEGGDLDMGHAGGGQLADELGLDLRRHEFRLDLQAVPGTDLADVDLLGQIVEHGSLHRIWEIG